MKQAIATNAHFVLVIEPHSVWDSLRNVSGITPNLVSDVLVCQSITSVVILYQEFAAETFVRAYGGFINNTDATHAMASFKKVFH